MQEYIKDAVVALFFAVVGFAFGPWGLFLAVALAILARFAKVQALPWAKSTGRKLLTFLKGL